MTMGGKFEFEISAGLPVGTLCIAEICKILAEPNMRCTITSSESLSSLRRLAF